MATRQGIIQVSRKDVAVSVRFATERMEAHEIEEAPEIVMWDTKTDEPVIRQRYVKETHDDITGEPPLPNGTTGYRYVNESGEEVPKERIAYYQKTPDGDRKVVEKRGTTVKKNEVLPIESWVDLDEVDEFLVEKTYELWGVEEEDEIALQDLVEYIRSEGETPLVVWLMQPDFFKSWGVVVPRVDEEDDRFTVLMKITRKRITPEHMMPLRAAEDIAERRKEMEERFVPQEAPG